MAITTFLSKAINRYLQLDPESKQRLHELQGKIVTVELLIPKLPLTKEDYNRFHLLFTETGIELKTDQFPHPNTLIKGTPLSLLRMTLTRENRQSFFSNDISITGDLELGQQVIALFDALEIDWEEYLSHWVGDVPAHQIGRFSSKFKTFCKRFRKTVVQNVNEYVHEEVDLFPPKEALHDFFHDVDTLRMDTDRLEARIQQLIARRDHS